jgi:hypothetical protein
VIATTAKPNPNGTLAEIRAYLERNADDKKAIVLNKPNFQSETNLSSDVNFNHFEVSSKNNERAKAITKGFIVLVPLIIPERKTDYTSEMLMILKIQIAQKVNFYCGY